MTTCSFIHAALGSGSKTRAEESFGFDERGPFRKVDSTGNAKGGRYAESLIYSVVADLGGGSQEMLCALAVDMHPRVKRRVRNLDAEPVHAFWLPTSAGRFYPDFVCELDDGRIFVAECRG